MTRAATGRGLVLLCLFAPVFCCLSCASDPREGYSFRSTYPADVRTISVPVFDNYSGTPGVEIELTEAVIKELQRVSGMRVVRAESADSRLSCVVTRVDMRRLSLQHSTGLVEELAYTVTVDFDWKDARNGKVLTSRRNFAATDTFVPALPTAERIDIGQHAAVQRLAKDIVAEMRASW